MSYGYDTTAEEVLEGVDLSGKRGLVTGVSSGIGVETARALVRHGADLTGTVRDRAQGEESTRAVSEAASRGRGAFELATMDLADLSSVRAFCDSVVGRGQTLDFIVANAGVMATPESRTLDGFETQFGVNYLGHFVLINRLAGIMNPGGRIVILSSSGHHFADVDLDDPDYLRSDYKPMVAYGRSKTAVTLFMVELDRRMRQRGVRAIGVHPGPILTGLMRHVDVDMVNKGVEQLNKQRAGEGLPPHHWKTIPQGAATTVWAVAVADPEVVGGCYCENCGISPVIPLDVTINPMTDPGVRAYAVDPERAVKMWTIGERMVGESFPV